MKLSKTQLHKIGQLGGFLGLNYLIAPIKAFLSVPQFIDNNSKIVLKNKDIIFDTIKTVDSSLKGIRKSFGAGITLTDNEIKAIMKVINSLENRGILFKWTTTKITSPKRGFLNFLRSLMTAGSPWKVYLPTPLAKNVLLPIGLSAGMSAADAAIQKEIYGAGTNDNFRWRNGRYNENS